MMRYGSRIPTIFQRSKPYRCNQGWEKSIVIDIRLRYFLLFVHRMHWSLYFFDVVSNMALPLLFFGCNSIFHIRFFLSRLLYFTLVNLKQSSVCHYLVFTDNFFFVPKKKTKKKRFSIAKLLCSNNVV